MQLNKGINIVDVVKQFVNKLVPVNYGASPVAIRQYQANIHLKLISKKVLIFT